MALFVACPEHALYGLDGVHGRPTGGESKLHGQRSTRAPGHRGPQWAIAHLTPRRRTCERSFPPWRSPARCARRRWSLAAKSPICKPWRWLLGMAGPTSATGSAASGKRGVLPVNVCCGWPVVRTHVHLVPHAFVDEVSVVDKPIHNFLHAGFGLVRPKCSRSPSHGGGSTPCDAAPSANPTMSRSVAQVPTLVSGGVRRPRGGGRGLQARGVMLSGHSAPSGRAAMCRSGPERCTSEAWRLSNSSLLCRCAPTPTPLRCCRRLYPSATTSQKAGHVSSTIRCMSSRARTTTPGPTSKLSSAGSTTFVSPTVTVLVLRLNRHPREC